MNNETPATAQPSFSPKTVRRSTSRQQLRLKNRQIAKRNKDNYPETSILVTEKQPFGANPIYTPRRKKLKGYEKERKRRYGHIKAA